MTEQPWRQGFVPRYGCGSFVLLWLYAFAANVVFLWLPGGWPSWSAVWAATAAGGCFGSAVLSAFNGYEHRAWDRKHPERPDGWTKDQHRQADDDEEFWT